MLPLNPMPAPRPRVTSKGWTYYPKPYKVWRERAAAIIPDILSSAGLEAPIGGALGISVDFAATRPKTTKLPFPKGDLDNFLKTRLLIAPHIRKRPMFPKQILQNMSYKTPPAT